jgi:hypothetical protein
MQKHFAIFCAKIWIVAFLLIASGAAADEAVFTGKLVRKYYDHLVPKAVEREVFGWFLELDSFSQSTLQVKIDELSGEDRQCCAKFAFDPSIVQLCLSGADDRQWCRNFEGKQVEVTGEWPTAPHMFRPIPSYQLHLTQIKQIPANVGELSGMLVCKVFPGPPNYDSVEDGDYPEEGWILKLDSKSKDVLAANHSIDMDEIEIEVEGPFEEGLQRYIGHKVVCRGILRDAENAHHHTQLLLTTCRPALQCSTQERK